MNTGTDSLSIYAGARVLVLGAAGFIGRWVASKLTERGAELVLHVRETANTAVIFNRYGVRGSVRALDLMAPGSAAQLVQEVRPQILFNLVGYGVDRRERDDKAAWRINFDLVREICVALAAVRDPAWSGVHFVHTGTAAEYGAAKGNLSEDVQARPTTPYGRTKLLGSLELLVRADLVGVRAVAARLFTVYGPGEHPGRLLPSLLEAAGTQEPLNLTGGLQQRDFTYVEDVAEGLLRLGVASLEEPMIVNLATGKLASVRTFAMTAAAVLGIPIDRLNFGALPSSPGEMEHDDVTVERMRELCGWVPPTTIAEGVARTRDFGARTL